MDGTPCRQALPFPNSIAVPKPSLTKIPSDTGPLRCRATALSLLARAECRTGGDTNGDVQFDAGLPADSSRVWTSAISAANSASTNST